MSRPPKEEIMRTVVVALASALTIMGLALLSAIDPRTAVQAVAAIVGLAMLALAQGS